VSFLILIVLLLVVMYVMLIRPQKRRQQDHQSMVDRAGVGEDVLTTGGIYGTIIETEGDDLVVEIAEGVTVHMTRRGIAAVLPPEEDEEADEVDADAEQVVEDGAGTEIASDDDSEPDEEPVTADEDAVTSLPEHGSVASERR
jgi:preprotein translocase subunit YajC